MATTTEQGLREMLLEDNSVWMNRFGDQDLGGAPVIGAAFSHFADQEYEFIHGERDTKHMTQSLMIAGAEEGMMGSVFGIVGEGKSEFLKYAARVIEGNDDESIAFVPHDPELTGAELLGKTKSTDLRTRNSNTGDVIDEEFTQTVRPIINEKTRAVVFDEFNITGVEAVKAARGFLQNGYTTIYTPDGPKRSHTMDLNIASFNHHGAVNTNRFSSADISRMAVGSKMGKIEPGQLISTSANKIIHEDDKKPTPEVNIVISRSNIDFLRSVVKEVRMSNNVKLLETLAIAAMRETYMAPEHRIVMGFGRQARQLKRYAKVSALRNGRPEVTAADVYDTTEYMLASKLGGFGLDVPEVGENDPRSMEYKINQTLDKLTEQYKKYRTA